MGDYFQHFIQSLADELNGPLPGQEAQYRMAPQPRSKPWKRGYDSPAPDARKGGVLILFYPNDGQIYFPMILRQTYDGVHSGQIGLPGGKFEDQDVNLIGTALRETHEEIGVSPQKVKVVGQLSTLYVFASNFLVQPIVGWVSERPAFQIDPREVAQLIETPLSVLCDPTNQHSDIWQLRDRTANVPYFRVQEHNVWGATAMMLSELLTLETISEGVS